MKKKKIDLILFCNKTRRGRPRWKHPYTDKLHHFVWKKKKKLHVTRDMWHVTRDVTFDVTRDIALTVWEWRKKDTAVSRILRIKHPRLLLMTRPEGCDEHFWAQRFIHIQADVYIHDDLGPWVFFCMLWGWIRVLLQHGHLSVVRFYSLIWTCNALISLCMSMFKEHQQYKFEIIMK